jgi:hypothetical protein
MLAFTLAVCFIAASMLWRGDAGGMPMKTPPLTAAQRAEVLGDRRWIAEPHVYEIGRTVADALRMLGAAKHLRFDMRLGKGVKTTMVVDPGDLLRSIQMDVDIGRLQPDVRMEIELRDDGWAYVGQAKELNAYRAMLSRLVGGGR